jgi:pyruvate decarboxylase
MKHLLPKLTARLHPLDSPSSSTSVPAFRAILPKAGEDPLGEEIISHLYFWPRISQFIRPEDVVVTETGTSSFGALEMPLPAKTIYVSQILWGSIGWATGAAVGAALAARERQLKGRTLLFTGDGSLQLTVQELSTAMRHGLSPILFVLNNKGYTIERHLHGRDRHYNDIVNWYVFVAAQTDLLKLGLGNGLNFSTSWLRRTCRQNQSRTRCARNLN